MLRKEISYSELKLLHSVSTDVTSVASRNVSDIQPCKCSYVYTHLLNDIQKLDDKSLLTLGHPSNHLNRLFSLFIVPY